MQKPMLTTIIIAALVLIAGGYLAYKYWKDRSQTAKSEIIETRDFSCPGMEDFTFKYPVFKGWALSEPKLSKENRCSIVVNEEGVNTLIKREIEILIAKNSPSELQDQNNTSQFNPNNIPFIYTKENSVFEIENFGYVSFYLKNIKVWVSFIQLSKNDGFPVDRFFQTVVESFKLVANYKFLPELKPAAADRQNALEAVRQDLKKNKENENDFYAKIEKAKNFGTDTVIVSLWDKKDYENKVAISGNPSGKSRDIYYNLDLKKITKIEFWQ